MPPSPKGKQNPPAPRAGRPDRTSAVVGASLAALAVTGVLTIFSGPLMALWGGSAADQGAAEAERGPAGAAAPAPPLHADGAADS
jgi:hypothetical protein